MLEGSKPTNITGAWGRRRLMALGATGAVGLSAGCLDMIFGDDESTERVEYVPASATVLGELSTDVFVDEGSLELLNVLVDQGPDIPVMGLLETFLEEDTPNLEDASDLLFFAQTDEDLSLDLEMLGVLVTADWPEEDVVTTLESYSGVSYSETEHEGSTVYEPDEDPLFSDAISLGVVDADAGVYVAGDTPAVEGSLGVAAGGDIVSGPALSAFNDNAGEDGTIAIEAQGSILPTALEAELSNQGLNPSPFESVESLGGTYDASDGVSVEANMYTTSASDAESISNIMNGILAVLRGQTEEQDILNEIDKIDIGVDEEDDEIIQITYDSNIDAVVTLLETVFTLLEEELGYGGGGGAGAAFDLVPTEANAVASINAETLADTEFQSISGVTSESLGAVFAEGEGAGVLELIDLAAFEEGSGLSLGEVSDLIGFATLQENLFETPERVAVIIEAGWGIDALVEGMESLTGTTYASAEYQGESVLYTPESGEDVYFGILTQSQFVFGDQPGVEAALDVQYGESEPIEGPVVEAYNDAGEGDMVGAVEPPGPLIPPETGGEFGVDLSDFEEVATVDGVFTTEESSVEGVGTITADNVEAAEGMGNMIPIILDAFDWGPSLTPEIEKIDIQQQEQAVRMSYQSDVDGVEVLIGELPAAINDL